MKKTATQIAIIAAVLGVVFLGGWIVGTRTYPASAIPQSRIDTVIVRDTIRESYPVVKEILTTRTDTVLVKVAGDTVYVAAEIPIEHKTYKTEDYKAEVEGFRASLVSMEIYRRTQFVTKAETLRVPDVRRWGVGLQAGYGLSVQGGFVKAHPYIGVGVQYSIFRW
jgi:hypothetical protein